MEQAFGFFIEQKVPVSRISQDIDAIIDLARSERTTFDGAVSRVHENPSGLATAMKPAQHYGEKSRQIDNVLVDEGFAQTASVLFEEIQKVLPPFLRGGLAGR